MSWKVPRIWEGGTCFIIGGGPSLLDQFRVPGHIAKQIRTKQLKPSALSPYMHLIHDHHVIGVNNAYLIGSWIDVLFFGDSSWYVSHKHYLKDWEGLKISCSPRFGNNPKLGIKYIAKSKKKQHGLTTDPSYIVWNKNSGAAAINLAVHFGVRRIVLLGFDMNNDPESGATHYHGAHATKITYDKGGRIVSKKPPYDRFLKGFPAIKQDADEIGVEIINANPKSKIDAFPKYNLRELSFV